MFSLLRWNKTLRDLWGNKARTILVVLSLAIGTATLGVIINTRTVLLGNMNRAYGSSGAASATIIVPEGFDDDLVDAIRRIPAVKEADGKHRVNLRIETGPNEFTNIDLHAFSDFDDIRLNKFKLDGGVWPPPDNEILLERSSLLLIGRGEVGETLTIRSASGKRREMKVAGLVQDINQMPAAVDGRAYGYITLETLAWLEEPESLNQISFTVAENGQDKNHIWAVAAQVEAKIEKSGRTSQTPVVPDPGEYPVMRPFSALIILLGSLGSLSLIGGGFLMINTINGLLIQQKRQIGVMKAIGAQSGQIIGIYLNLVFVISLLSLLIGLPLAAWGGSRLSQGLGWAFNVDLIGSTVPVGMVGLEAIIGFTVPFLAAIYPIMSGTRVTVREAINDYGMDASSKKNFFDKFLEQLRGIPRPIMLSIRNTFRRKSRLTLTLIALTLSGSIFISAYNIRDSLLNTLEGIFAYRNYDATFFFEQPRRIAKTERNMLNLPEVTDVESFYFSGDVYRVRAGLNRGFEYGVNALRPENRAFRPPIQKGRWLQPQDQAVMVVNEQFLREETDVQLGDTVELEIDGEDISLQVVGVVEEAFAQPTLYLNYDYFARTFGLVGRANAAWVKVADSNQAVEVIKTLETQFEYNNVGIRRILAAADERQFLEEHFNLIAGFMTIAAILLAIVGGLGLMGTMSINVVERVREIGIMRAVGASNGAIQRVFVIEGMVIGGISWGLSLIVGIAPTKVLGDAVGLAFLETPLDYTFSVMGMLVWLIIVIAVSAISCFVPAERASQVKVNELLAYE